MNHIGHKIKELRRKNDLTQEKLADFLGVTYQSVSKWENGITMPDLSQIVPLARVFHISTDELLGMDPPGNDPRKAEYDAMEEKAHHPDQTETARCAVAEYPGELKYVLWLAGCLYMRGHEVYYSDRVSFTADLEEALHHNRIVYEHTDNDELKRRSIAGIVMTLAALERYEEAKEYAKLYPTAPNLDRETVIGWTLTGEEKIRHHQQMTMNALDELLRNISGAASHDAKNQLACLDCAKNLILTLIPDGNYLRYLDTLKDLAVARAKLLQDTDPDSAIESLAKARQYAEEFDRLFMNHPVCRPFTSPFFDRLSFDSAELLVYGPLKDNLRTDDFRSMVTPQTFPALRDREEFGVIIA